MGLYFKPGDSVTRIVRTALVSSAVLVAAFLSFLVAIWWGSLSPRRPRNISSAGVFLERGVVPFKLSTHGHWLDCWQDVQTRLDHCRLVDEEGRVKFEDTFFSYQDHSPIPETDLKIDPLKTRSLTIGVAGGNIALPVIFLQNGEILLPDTDYAKARKSVDLWVYGHGAGH
jgi:hypothetical protein